MCVYAFTQMYTQILTHICLCACIQTHTHTKWMLEMDIEQRRNFESNKDQGEISMSMDIECNIHVIYDLLINDYLLQVHISSVQVDV